MHSQVMLAVLLITGMGLTVDEAVLMEGEAIPMDEAISIHPIPVDTLSTDADSSSQSQSTTDDLLAGVGYRIGQATGYKLLKSYNKSALYQIECA